MGTFLTYIFNIAITFLKKKCIILKNTKYNLQENQDTLTIIFLELEGQLEEISRSPYHPSSNSTSIPAHNRVDGIFNHPTMEGWNPFGYTHRQERRLKFATDLATWLVQFSSRNNCRRSLNILKPDGTWIYPLNGIMQLWPRPVCYRSAIRTIYQA